MTKLKIFAGLVALTLATGCARTEPMQPDRSVFNVDASYQRSHYAQPIEATFDRTVAVFREAGYKLDVIDRATGQIRGIRGKSGDKGADTGTDLRFYALVLPDGKGSQIALRIAQISSQGIPVLAQAKTEIVLNQPELYAYIFRRIGGISSTQTPDAEADLAPQAQPSYQQ
ncbi:hypothetical protein D5I55_03190 [Chakrabartia godavariana]|nr:hypothetical protein D5I55_03190 [Chakrabartia godavariana]